MLVVGVGPGPVDGARRPLFPAVARDVAGRLERDLAEVDRVQRVAAVPAPLDDRGDRRPDLARRAATGRAGSDAFRRVATAYRLAFECDEKSAFGAWIASSIEMSKRYEGGLTVNESFFRALSKPRRLKPSG